MKRLPTPLLLALAGLCLGAPQAAAQVLSFTTRVSVEVRAVCEVESVTPERLTLHCTRDFVPQHPWLLPELSGKLPQGELTWLGQRRAPSGGTYNDYRVTAAGADSTLVFY